MTDADFDQAFAVTLANFAQWVVSTSEAQATSWQDGAKLIGLAQELCAADAAYPSRVEDTNRVVSGSGYEAPMYDVKKTVLLLPSTQVRPAWWLFLPEAKRALDYLGPDVTYEAATRFLETVREVRP